MFPIKAIKIGLPVATATSAAIATTSLVSFSKKDEIQKEEDLDKALNDFQIPNDKYQDEKMFYSKDGTGKNQKILDPETAERLAKILKKNGNLNDVDAPHPDKKLSLDFDQTKIKNSGTKLPSDSNGQREQDSIDMPNDESGREQKDAKLQTNTNLSDQISDADYDNKYTKPEPASGKGEEQSSQSPKLDALKQDLTAKPESGEDLTARKSIPEKNKAEGDLNSGRETSDLDNNVQQESDPEATGGENQKQDDSERGAQDQQTPDPEEHNLAGKRDGGEDSEGKGSPKPSEVGGESNESSSVGSQIFEGTDTLGNKQNLTDEDIQRWSDVESEISSVVGELKSLINI